MIVITAPGKLIAFAAVVISLMMARHHQQYHSFVKDINYPVPSTQSMNLAFGTGNDLSPGETRRLYNRVVSSLSNWTEAAATAGLPVPAQAAGCSLLRHRIKLYARSRQKWFTGGEFLPLIDAFRGVIGFRIPYLSQVLDIPYCLAQHPDYPCPSMMTLAARHRGNMTRVLGSCFRSNKRVNWALDSTSAGLRIGESTEGFVEPVGIAPNADVDSEHVWDVVDEL